MKNLISMTDYCQEVSSEFMSPKKPFDKNYWFGKILNYSDFIKQPLELWMFVPCDKYGNVVEFDENEEKYTKYHIQKYKQAKEACLFEGCGLMDGWCLQFQDGTLFGNIKSLNEDTIESLIQYDLQLTQTAIKNLGL